MSSKKTVPAPKRLSYWVFVVVFACAALPEALPYFKDSVPPWLYGVLAVLGIAFQHYKQEVFKDEQVPSQDQ